MKKRKGSILVLTMFMTAIFALLAGILLQLVISNSMMISKKSEVYKSFWIAKAGISQTLHDLKDYYFLEQQQVKEKEFGGGLYKSATATLIGKGFHNTLIVSTGYYPIVTGDVAEETSSLELTSSNVTKYSFTAEVEMNAATDYVHFVETTFEPYSRNGFLGPVHVNGDIHVGKDWAACYFYKPETDYGPTMSCSGKIYITHTYDDDTSFAGGDTYQTAVSEGKFTSCNKQTSLDAHYPLHPWLGTFYPAELSLIENKNLFYISKRGVRKVYNGLINHTTFKTTVSHTAPDQSQYSYDLMQDKQNGGVFIKIPTAKNLDKSLFTRYISADWTLNFSNPGAGKVTYITNESKDVNKQAYTKYTGENMFASPNVMIAANLNSYFSISGFEIPFPQERDADYMKYVMFKYPTGSTYSTLVAPVVGANQNSDPGGPGDSMTPAFPGPRFSMDSYTIDRQNKKFKFKYPIVWDNFEFRFAPGLWGATGGKWMGRSLKQAKLAYAFNSYFGCTSGVNNQSVDPKILERYLPIFADPNNTFGHKVVVEVADTGVSPMTVVGYWCEVADLCTATATDKVFTVNHATGVITFGDGVKGQKPPFAPYVNISGNVFGAPFPTSRYVFRYIWWSHEFPSDLSAWIHSDVKVVKMDLSTLNAQNCPRDTKYPNDPEKLGIIYSQVPLVVFGTPKVPVTIYCEDDVYVGPVNSDRLIPGNVDDHKNISTANFIEDDPNAKPVGIMSKKTIWMDYTYAVGGDPDAIKVNTFVDSTHASGYGKTLKFNKVALYAPYFRSPTYGTNYNSQLQTPYIGESVYARRNSVSNISPNCAWMFTGSVYKSLDEDFIKTVAAPKYDIQAYVGARFLYSSSFRTAPPQHMPIDIKINSYNMLSDPAKGPVFVDGFKELLDTYGTDSYNVDFATKLSAMIEALGKE